MKNRLDRMYIGVIAGIIFPPIAYYGYIFFSYQDVNPIDLLKGYAAHHILAPVISLAVLSNLLIFYIFLQKKYELAAKGIIISTLIYFMLVLIIKLT